METAETYTSGTNADSSQSPAAAPVSAPTTTVEAVTPETTPAAAVDGATETQTNTPEGAEGATEEKKTHQKTLEERAEEIADRKIQQRIQEAEERRKSEVAATPDYVPVDYDAYDNHIARLIATERQIQDELTVDPENPAELVRALRKIQQQRQSLEASFAENEKKRQAFEEKNKLTQQEQAAFQQKQMEIGKAVSMMSQSLGLASEVVDAGIKYIDATFATNPSLQQKFNSIVDHKTMYQGFSGPDAAVEWAFNYAKENMGKDAQADRERRETGKETNPGAAGQGGSSQFANISTYSDLMKLPSAQINQFAKEHSQKFKNLKDKHFK